MSILSREWLLFSFPTTLKSLLFILLSPLRFRIGEFWRLHSRGVLYLKHMFILVSYCFIADRVQATIMSCKHDNHFPTDTLFIAFIIARHCLICNSSISERTSIASDNSSEFSSFFPYIMKSTDTPSTIARLSNVCVLKSPPFSIADIACLPIPTL